MGLGSGIVGSLGTRGRRECLFLDGSWRIPFWCKRETGRLDDGVWIFLFEDLGFLDLGVFYDTVDTWDRRERVRKAGSL